MAKVMSFRSITLIPTWWSCPWRMLASRRRATRRWVCRMTPPRIPPAPNQAISSRARAFRTASHLLLAIPRRPTRVGQDMLHPMRLGLAGVSYNGADAVAHGRHKVGPEFFGAYRSLLKLVSVMGLQRIKVHVALRHVTVIGTASTYNPYRGVSNTNNIKTASGDPYDPTAWTAAIQIDLREHFGGIHYGRNYQPAYALVENGEKQIIVKVNDVGPLKPGRLIDLSERSMRYFDPLQ